MHALLLDYQHHRRKPRRLELVLLAGGLAMAVYLSIHSVNVFSEISTLEAKQAELARKSNREAPDTRLASLDAQQLRVEVKQANEVLAQLALPWENLFKDIESSEKNHIALLAIEPDAEKRIIKITGEAKDLNAMLGYIRFLQKKESLTGVFLQNHRVDLQTAEKPVRFAVIASWVVQP